MIHAIVCSYLGDGEVDIGKTAAWLNSFVDTTFFYDMNYGTAARHYGIDYAKTFPDAQFAIHPVSEPAYWVNPAVYRHDAFLAAKAAWNYADTDWVVFIDASESLSVNVAFDALTPPPIGSVLLQYLYAEAAAATGNVLAFPVYVFLQQGTVAEHTMVADLTLAQAIDAEQAALTAELATGPDANRTAQINARLADLNAAESFNNSVVYWTCQPRYLAIPSTLKFARMLKVSAAPSFNWAAMDDTTAAAAYPGTATTTAIVSYAYARYVEGEPNRANWTQAADIGFVNRLQMQTLAPRDLNLPETYATADPSGTAATSPSAVSSPAYCYFYDQFDTGSGNLTFQQWVGLWRVNPRDGVWYVDYTLGAVPLNPVTGAPSVPPDTWASQQPSTTGPA